MPKTRGEDDKKHGDKLESLIERTRGNASSRNGKEWEEDEDEDPAALQDDDDEDVQNDDVETRRDVGERE
jgi:hypothetical protein